MKTHPAPRPAGPPAPLAIAIADDMSEIRQLARHWLTHAGHSVVCAADGAELVRMFRERHLDVVITDVMMPERDGLEVITELRKARPGVRIIAISGGGTVMPAADCLRVAKRLGAHATLTKPFNRTQLMSVLDHVVAGHA